jgi:hypothetical protein
MMAVDVEVEARPAGVFPDEAGGVGFLDGFLKHLALADVFAAQVDIALTGAHGEGRDQATLDQQVRIVAHDVPVLAGARLGFIRINDEIVRPLAYLLRHEGPFQAGGKPRPAAPAQAGSLHLLADPFRAEGHELARGVPCAAGARLLHAPVVATIQVREDAILVEQHQRGPPPEPGRFSRM